MADENNETGITQKNFPCLNYNCDKRYSSKSSRSNHMKKCLNQRRSPRKKIKLSVKGGKDKVKCKNCPKIFQHGSSLARHQNNCNATRLHEGKEPLPEKPRALTEFTCTTCCKTFDRSSKLDNHMKSKHLGDTDKYCNICGKKFKRTDFFERHVSSCGINQLQVRETEVEGPGESTSQEEYSDSTYHFQASAPSFIPYEEMHSFQPRVLEYETANDTDVTPQEDVDMIENNNVDIVVEEINMDIDENIDDEEITVIIPSDFASNLSSTVIVSPDNINDHENTIYNISSLSQLGSPTVSDEEDDNDNDDDESFCQLLCEGVINDLKKHKSDSDYLFARLYSYFGTQLTYDEKLQKWLTKSLAMRKHRFLRRLFKWLQPKVQVPRGNRPFLDSSRQIIHDAWIENSTISVDRRDGRDMVRMPMALYKEQYYGVETSLVSTYINKRKMVMAQAPRYMCHVTTRKMIKILEDKYSMKVGLGTVHGLRPFFVDCPSDREKLECLCTVCCNARNLFEAIQKRVKSNSMKEYTSITSYLTSGHECTKDRNGYISRPCITGTCKTCNGIIKPEPYIFKEDDVVTYYQFELVPTGKVDKEGKPKKKTQRVDYNSVPTTSVVTKLNAMASRYLLHRYDVCNDKFVMPLIQVQCDENGEFIVHMDFSENLKEKPKKETQAHHFSGEQHTLHCSYVQTPEGNKYFYHFSDVKLHNWRFTKAVIMDLLEKVFKHQDTIRIKTDNCTTQYKCLYVFGMYSDLAKKLKKTFILYFGAAGHGRCLVDGMSSWGVKNPLRMQIIVADFYWKFAADLVRMFHGKGFQTEDRDYSELTTEYIQGFETVTPRPLVGCTKMHMIAYHIDGSVQHKQAICDCVMCFSGEFLKCMYENPEVINDGNDNEDNDDEEGYGEDDDNDDDADLNAPFEMLCEIIQPGQIIALRTSPEEKQSFYLVAVNEMVKNSQVEKYDIFQHCVIEGDNYISCHYLDIEFEKKNFVQYRRCKSEVYVLPGEVLSPFVNIGDNLQLSMDEKQWLSDMA